MTQGGTRTCSNCGEAKPLDAFNNRSKQCKPCLAAKARERYRSDAAYREKVKLRVKRANSRELEDS